MRSIKVLLCTFGIVLIGSSGLAKPQSKPPQAPRSAGAAQTPAPAPGADATFTMALTGDSIITRKISVYREPAFLRMIEILRGADVAFTNLEMLFHDYESYAMSESGGTYMRAEPALVHELTWAGFDMVARANNHTGDYGVAGMRLTTQYVAKAGLIQAGVGESLAEAREARFMETAKARVALISVASSYPDHSRAGRTRGDVPPRPGLNPLRFQTTYTVTRDRLETLRATLKEAGARVTEQADSLTVFGSRFVAGDKPGMRTEPLAEDLDEIAAVVNNASRLADRTIVTVHTHEADGHRSVPAQFLVTFARAMIDAGADVVAGHGPHVLRGIEIYKGKPIFYSLGNFLFENESLLRLPSENYEAYRLGPTAHVADFGDARTDSDRRGWPIERDYWEAVVAVPMWNGPTLSEVKLYPVALGFGQSKTHRGRPMLAEGATAQKILDDMVRLSTPFGTKIEIRDGVGVMTLARPTGK